MIDSRWSRDFFWECLVLFTIHYTRGLMFLPSASIMCRIIFTKLLCTCVCIFLPGSLSFLINNSKRYHSCICRGLEHVVGHNLTMQIKVEILYYPKMWLLYCTNKIIIFFPPYDYSVHESALKMQFRVQKCPQDVIPRVKVPFSLKQHRALFQSWAEH